MSQDNWLGRRDLGRGGPGLDDLADDGRDAGCEGRGARHGLLGLGRGQQACRDRGGDGAGAGGQQQGLLQRRQREGRRGGHDRLNARLQMRAGSASHAVER